MSSNSVDKSDLNDPSTYEVITPEFLNSTRTPDLPNHIIKLKVGTLIMLMRNLDQYEGLCKVTKLIVTKLVDHVLEEKIMSGKHEGNVIYIPIMTTSHLQSPWSFKLSRSQISIIVSCALTINKSHGQSPYFIGLYFHCSVFSHCFVFSHGKLDVAVSRGYNK